MFLTWGSSILLPLIISVLCSTKSFLSPGRIPFAFLEDIHQRFVRTYGRAVLSAHAYGMNDEFSRVLSQQMEYYTNDPNADRINRLKGEMSQVSFVYLSSSCLVFLCMCMCLCRRVCALHICKTSYYSNIYCFFFFSSLSLWLLSFDLWPPVECPKLARQPVTFHLPGRVQGDQSASSNYSGFLYCSPNDIHNP